MQLETKEGIRAGKSGSVFETERKCKNIEREGEREREK